MDLINLEGVPLQKEICNYLLERDCCYRCCVRFLGVNPLTKLNYKNPIDTLKELGLDLGIVEEDDERQQKRSKSNYCRVCLNILSDDTIPTLLKNEEIEVVSQYDSPTFFISLSFPKVVLLRSYSMLLLLQGAFPDYYKNLTIETFSKVWRKSFASVIQSKVNKIYCDNSDGNLEVRFRYDYLHDDEESKYALKLNRNKNCDTSRTFINEVLKDISRDDFSKYYSVPPSTPTEGITSIRVTCCHQSIYFAARYCKYARNIGQTPWIKDGTQIYTSVQEIIFKELIPIFNCSELVFTTSGREDCDVRMLGRGRPFIVKVVDPKVTKLSFEQCREIEDKIARSKVVKIRDFQLVSKSSLENIKKGEETKKKSYQAKCYIPNTDSVEKCLTIINDIKDLTIKQRTPVRVLHRRTNAERSKMIFSIHAEIDPNGPPGYILINITSQAGTYIKEFIHSDLGRTIPSLGDLLNEKIEFISLDVTDIDLDYPPSISAID